LSEEDKNILLLSLKEDSKEILYLIHGKNKWWEGIWMWIFPIVLFILLVISILWFIKRKQKEDEIEFGGYLD